MTYEELNVLYEDNHIIVVVKPQNVPSQEDSSKDADLLSIVKEYIKVKYNKPGNAFVGLVHRLDRPTGGVMVFARTSKAAERLCESMREGDFDKKYLAVTIGTPVQSKALITHYLMKDEKNNTVTAVAASTFGAKKCELIYKVLEVNDKIALVGIELLTGRSHQARVQLSSINHPIFGDAKYGGDILAKGYNLALWAYELRFPHPVTKQQMIFKVFPPVDDTPWKYFAIERHIPVGRPD